MEPPAGQGTPMPDGAPRVTLPVATRPLARLSRERRPLPGRLQLLAREARLIAGLPLGGA